MGFNAMVHLARLTRSPASRKDHAHKLERSTSSVQSIALAVGYEQKGLCWVVLNFHTQTIDVRF